jgi:NADP-dependent 3-hydroxy acid dehydrogenase YdfG
MRRMTSRASTSGRMVPSAWPASRSRVSASPIGPRLKIVPTQAVYAATKNAVRTLLEGLRQESTDGVLRTTAVSPGFVRTELAASIDDADVRAQIVRSRDEFAIAPEAVARAIAFAIEQPYDVEIGDITIRPTVQG